MPHCGTSTEENWKSSAMEQFETIENTARVLGKSFLGRVYDIGRNKVREDLIFSINGRNIKDIKGKIEIKEGDRVAIFPPIAGG